jgi:hypothetical protein
MDEQVDEFNEWTNIRMNERINEQSNKHGMPKNPLTKFD